MMSFLLPICEREWPYNRIGTAAVWSGENAHNFDFIDAARTLEPDHRRVVVEWLNDPYFP